MAKPFSSIERQIQLLEQRGVITDDETGSILMREGYYSVVNGYKEPFIDLVASKEAGDDRYIDGTTFKEIHRLFTFDRSLRELTFHYLIRTEALVKTACAYCFSERHRGPEDYLKADSYATEEQYKKFGLKNHTKNLVKLTSILEDISMSSRSEFTKHYREKYGEVPLWVLANDITFGNVQHFFNLMKPEEQFAVCKHISTATGRSGSTKLGYFKPSEAKTSIDYLVKFRNCCAHDDRLYCAKFGTHKECGYAMLIKRIERFLPEDEYEDMLKGVIELLNSSVSTSPIMKHLISNMGFNTREIEGKTHVIFK